MKAGAFYTNINSKNSRLGGNKKEASVIKMYTG